MRRLLLDFLALVVLVVAGVALYAVSGFTESGLNLFSRFENVIWILIAVGVAFVRARFSFLKVQGPLWIGLLEWIAIVVAAHLILFWLNVVVHPQDDFKTTFAFGFLIFLVPSTAVSAIVYFVFRFIPGSRP